MVWYPSADDVVNANKIAMRKNKHPHRIIRSIQAIEATIENIKKSESEGLTYQAARFMKDLTLLHAFDGGNHRTAYSMTVLFLLENAATVRVVPASVSFEFVKRIGGKEIKEIQEWIERWMV